MVTNAKQDVEGHSHDIFEGITYIHPRVGGKHAKILVMIGIKQVQLRAGCLPHIIQRDW